jgi:hypothetical protein
LPPCTPASASITIPNAAPSLSLRANQTRIASYVLESASDNFPSNLFAINTYKSVSKQTTSTPFRMNTYEKPRGKGPLLLTSYPMRIAVLTSAARKDPSAFPAKSPFSANSPTPFPHFPQLRTNRAQPCTSVRPQLQFSQPYRDSFHHPGGVLYKLGQSPSIRRPAMRMGRGSEETPMSPTHLLPFTSHQSPFTSHPFCGIIPPHRGATQNSFRIRGGFSD